MLDVLSILGFTLHAAHKVCDAVQSIKDAPDAIKALEKEATRVRTLLAKMLPPSYHFSVSLLQRIGTDDPQLAVLADDAKILTNAVDALLSRATTRREDGTHQVKKRYWLFYAGEANSLAEQFEAFYASLVAISAMYTLYVTITAILHQASQRDQKRYRLVAHWPADSDYEPDRAEYRTSGDTCVGTSHISGHWWSL